jgi:hypothetical protein
LFSFASHFAPQGSTWGDRYNFLSNTWVSNAAFHPIQVGFCAAVSAGGGSDVCYASVPVPECGDHPWKHKVTPDTFKTQLKDVLPLNRYCHPGPQSKSPDGFIRVGMDVVEQDDDVSIAFPCKLGKTAQSWAVLKEEIEKAELMVDAGFRTVVVFIATTLGAEVVQMVQASGSSYVLLHEGQYVYDKRKHTMASLHSNLYMHRLCLGK